jgi:hypothetical protein
MSKHEQSHSLTAFLVCTQYLCPHVFRSPFRVIICVQTGAMYISPSSVSEPLTSNSSGQCVPGAFLTTTYCWPYFHRGSSCSHVSTSLQGSHLPSINSIKLPRTRDSDAATHIDIVYKLFYNRFAYILNFEKLHALGAVTLWLLVL